MKSNPFAKHNNITIYEKHEDDRIPNGCCFSQLNVQKFDHQRGSPIRSRFYSQTKEPTNKKIDLVIARRSSSKESNTTGQRHSSLEGSSRQVKPQVKDRQSPKLSITMNSKLNSQRTNYKSSKVSFNRDLKLDRPQPEVKQSCMTTRNTTKPLYTEGNPQNNEQEMSMALISDIAFVEEEFISHESEALQTMNLVAQLKNMENRTNQLQIKSHRITTQRTERLPSEKEITNPFRRLEKKKKFQTGVQKRLLL